MDPCRDALPLVERLISCATEAASIQSDPNSMNALDDEFPWNFDRIPSEREPALAVPDAPPTAGPLRAPQISAPLPLPLFAALNDPHPVHQVRWYGLNE